MISVPLAFFGGIGAASSNGVLVKGSNYLELLSHLHTVVSDKTGTLTEGNFQVSEVLPAAGVEKTELLHMAALAEGMSTHPIAKSIRDAYAAEAANTEINTALVTDTVNVSGQGLIATLPGHRIFVGNAKLMQAYGIDFTEETNAAATVSYVAVEENSSLPADTSSAAGQPAGSDGAAVGSIGAGKEKGGIRYLGAILIRDQLKPEAKDAIAEMKREGVQNVVMLTGDRKAVGEAVGQELGLDYVYTDLLPQEKVEKVEVLLTELDHHGRQQDRAELAFIGDGINDAPVLARADVGIAMGSMGSDAAIEAAEHVDRRLRRRRRRRPLHPELDATAHHQADDIRKQHMKNRHRPFLKSGDAYPKSSELTNTSALSFFSTPVFIEMIAYVRHYADVIYTQILLLPTHIFTFRALNNRHLGNEEPYGNSSYQYYKELRASAGDPSDDADDRRWQLYDPAGAIRLRQDDSSSHDRRAGNAG